MAERPAYTYVQVLGTEIITGKKTDEEGNISEPTAEINLPQRAFTTFPAIATDTILFAVDIKYQEATEKEDVPHFLLELLDEDGNVYRQVDWSPERDTYETCDTYETTIWVAILFDAEDIRGKRLHLRAHLKCWLEESSWATRGDRGEETVSAEDYVNITLVVPRLRDPGPNPPDIMFNVVGRTLHVNEAPKGYEQQYIGEKYKIIAAIANRTNNDIRHGELKVYENDMFFFEFPWTRETRIATGDSIGFVEDSIRKSWTWYVELPNRRLYITDRRDKTFIYKLRYFLQDEYAFIHRGAIIRPLRNLKIVVSIPQYKLDAVETYNWSFDEEETGMIADFILGADLIALAALVSLPAAAAGGSTVAGLSAKEGWYASLGISIGDFLVTWYASATISELAQDLRRKLKLLIDDPPKFDKKYKQVIKPQIKKLLLPKPKTLHEKTLHSMAKLESSIGSNIEALIVTSSRVWSAELKKNKVATAKQKTALRTFRNKLQKELQRLADNYKNLSKLWTKSRIKFNPAQFIAFKQQVKCKGMPAAIKARLKKRGFSNKRIAKIQKAILGLDVDQLDIVKTHLNYSKSLRKLSKSIGEFK